MTAASRPPRLLVLFQGPWEDEFLMARRDRGELELHREGFESFGYPQVLRLCGFDARRYAARLARRYRGRIDAVWSNDDQIGVLLAAWLARELGLPGAPPAAVVTAQHKLLLRRALAAAGQAGGIRHALALPHPLGDRRLGDPAALAAAVAAAGAAFPLFAKPAKGTFSLLARRLASADELAGHLRLPLADRWLFRRLARPFAQLAAAELRLPCGPDHLMLETPLSGRQVNVDGYAHDGEIRALGVVDELMYPGEVRGARHFAGFVYPAALPEPVRAAVTAAAIAAVRAIDYRHGLWNVELFVDAAGAVTVIEVNPRWAGQFATFYREVDGLDLEQLAIALALGRSPDTVPRQAPCAGAAASFVFRQFDGGPGPTASPAAVAAVAARHPRARLWLEPAAPRALRREYRWFGSHRYAVWNHAAADLPTLWRDGQAAARELFGVEWGAEGPG